MKDRRRWSGAIGTVEEGPTTVIGQDDFLGFPGTLGKDLCWYLPLTFCLINVRSFLGSSFPDWTALMVSSI
jgi:hypothetical protein